MKQVKASLLEYQNLAALAIKFDSISKVIFYFKA